MTCASCSMGAFMVSGGGSKTSSKGSKKTVKKNCTCKVKDSCMRKDTSQKKHKLNNK